MKTKQIVRLLIFSLGYFSNCLAEVVNTEGYGQPDVPLDPNALPYKDLYMEFSGLRTRELKRRLAIDHGYSAPEIASMIHKSELIHALSQEVYLEESKKRSETNRKRIWHIAITLAIAVGLYALSPLWIQAYDVISVNIVVYTDRKFHEASRCFELRSVMGFLGYFLMTVIECLSFWLSISVLLSWFVKRNAYFFPIPNLPIRPGALLNSATGGDPSNTTGLAGYAINCGPMAISWFLKFINGIIQNFMGRTLARAQKRKKQARKEKKKSKKTPEEKAARKAEKALRKAEREAKAAQMKEVEEKENIRDMSTNARSGRPSMPASNHSPETGKENFEVPNNEKNSTNIETNKGETSVPQVSETIENMQEYLFDDLD
mmetsp:Transcript_6131/g.8920  ORF Transcript_6131/g.8920 Transcript_6131/m.8920 type:complete len:375 (-) Transcript_6131:45-1169(-)